MYIITQFSNLEKGSFICFDGILYIWNGFKNNKPRLQKLYNEKDMQNSIIQQITRKNFDECFPNKTVNDRIKINGVPYTIFEINKMRVKLYRRIYEEMNDANAEKEIILSEIQARKSPIKAIGKPRSMVVKKELPLTKEDIEFQKEVYKMQHFFNK